LKIYEFWNGKEGTKRVKLRNAYTVFTRKQPALEFNPHSNVIRNFWEKKKMKSALECNPQRFCEFWFLIWITTWPTVMEVASCKNRQNTKENAKIWQFLLKATKLVSLNWKMTPNYSVYFGLMGKRFLSEKCCGLYWNEGCSLDLGSKNSGYIGMRVLLECGFNWKKYGIYYCLTFHSFLDPSI